MFGVLTFLKHIRQMLHPLAIPVFREITKCGVQRIGTEQTVAVSCVISVRRSRPEEIEIYES